MRGIFIAGTGTDVGKTYVAALMTKLLLEAGCSAGYYKAAASGNERTGNGLAVADRDFVRTFSGMKNPKHAVVSYAYERAVSPHLAAKEEGNPVDLKIVERDFCELSSRCDFITAEGSGGAACPVRWDEQKILLENVIRLLSLPVLLVSASGLGSINAAVLSAEYLVGRGIALSGIAMNGFDESDPLHRDNRKMIEELTKSKVLFCVPEGAKALSVSGRELSSLYREAGI